MNKRYVFVSVISIFIASIISWTLLISIIDLADSISLDSNRCEISGLLNNCPAQTSLKITRRDGLVFDNARGASSSRPICMVRAEEYYHWCGSKLPVTARFFRDSKLIEQKVYPNGSMVY